MEELKEVEELTEDDLLNLATATFKRWLHIDRLEDLPIAIERIDSIIDRFTAVMPLSRAGNISTKAQKNGINLLECYKQVFVNALWQVLVETLRDNDIFNEHMWN